jgi:hypothetical protein
LRLLSPNFTSVIMLVVVELIWILTSERTHGTLYLFAALSAVGVHKDQRRSRFACHPRIRRR